MCQKEFEGEHPLNTLPVDAHWGWIPLVFPEVNHHLLSFAGLGQQVVFRTPTCQLVELIPVRSLIPSADETDDRGVIRKFNEGIGGVDGCTVMCLQGIQERAQHTALRRACAECQGGGAGGTYLNHLRAVSQKVFDPGTGGGVDVILLVQQNVRNNGVKCQT